MELMGFNRVPTERFVGTSLTQAGIWVVSAFAHCYQRGGQKGVIMPAGTKIGQAADGDGENVRIESGDIIPTVDEFGSEHGVELVTLDARVQAQLGQQLSVYYSNLISEPVPESFILLLAKLDKSENKG